MDNPWATPVDPADPWPQPEADIALPAWSVRQWPAPWLPAAAQARDATSEQDITQDERGASQLPPFAATEPAASLSDHQVAHPVPETAGPSATRISDEHDLDTAPHDDWEGAWGAPPSSEPDPKDIQAPDQWEAARQEKEKFNRAVPPELLDSLLRHCQQVSQEIWPVSETSDEDDWKSGFENLPDVAALLAQLVPADPTLPPAVQFSATATAKAMNEALKLTRHSSASAGSPLSRLLASKGSIEWEKSVKTKLDVVPDTAHVGWRVLEKQGHLRAVDESKPKKATGGLLSFWNRRASAVQAAPVDTPSERSARSSLESAKSGPQPPSSRAASPSRAPVPPIPPALESNSTVVVTAPAPSAVSRFLNRFSRPKSAQHGALALSSDDLEFLSDIVPSASDPPDEDAEDTALKALIVASNSSLAPRLPPPISPPPKQPALLTRPSIGASDGVSVAGSTPTAFQVQGTNYAPNNPVLAPSLLAKPMTSSLRIRTPSLSLKEVAAPTIGQSATSLIQPRQPNSQPSSRGSSTLPPPQKVFPLLSIPPLLPPPPVSPPQTPRPGAFPSNITLDHLPMMRNNTSSFHDTHDSDEFSAFASFPPSTAAPFPSLDSPSPPSPPPRREYERTHYPSSSSASSILSPASRTSVDQLCSARSSISASFDSFDDFVSSPPVVRGGSRKRTPSPPPLPNKHQSQHQKLPRAPPSGIHHGHTSSHSFTSPTINTSLMNNMFPAPSVSDAEHQRTQSLVDHAAARGGLLWPNSPDLDEPNVMPIPPPLSSTSPKSSIGEEDFNLLDDVDTLHGGLEAWHAPLNVEMGIGMDTTASSSATGPLDGSFEIASDPGKGLGSRNQLQPSPPPLPSVSTPLLSFSSLGTPASFIVTTTGSSQPAKPRQIGGLSAQDLSFFEGL